MSHRPAVTGLRSFVGADDPYPVVPSGHYPAPYWPSASTLPLLGFAHLPLTGGVGPLLDVPPWGWRCPESFNGEPAEQATKPAGGCGTGTRVRFHQSRARSGGGAVTAVVDGKHLLKSLEIQPEVVDPEDTEMLADLVMAAVNEAIRQAVDTSEAEMSKITGGINMPGLF